jgi:uncharacterized lipoprotein YddW (UPF0748 family)
MKRILSLIIAAFFALISCTHVLAEPVHGNDTPRTRLGVWITVFSPHDILGSAETADTFIEKCREAGITDIFLQLYRADKAYYDSDITDRSPFDRRVAGAGKDLIPYLLDRASSRGIRVHAWVNMLCIAHNRDANILRELGPHITTKDQYGRTALIYKKDELDEYYIREDQLFLEPGYPGVREYLADISEEIVRRYPGFSGLHLDYIRYPAAVPFIPGSRFTSHGITYGYNWPNIKAFMDMTGKDIREGSPGRAGYMKWDSLRRNNVSLLVKAVSERVRTLNSDMEISCTIVPSMERTYLVTLQDWTRWLEEDMADFVVTMNYTDDARLFELNTRSADVPALRDDIMVGVGAYLLKKRKPVLKEQLSFLRRLSPPGVVIFSYDDIAGDRELREFLNKSFR